MKTLRLSGLVSTSLVLEASKTTTVQTTVSMKCNLKYIKKEDREVQMVMFSSWGTAVNWLSWLGDPKDQVVPCMPLKPNDLQIESFNDELCHEVAITI